MDLRLDIDDKPTQADVQVLRDGLNTHALRHTGEPGFSPVAVWLRDGDDKVVAGAYGMLSWNFLEVNLLWVDESLRGTGLGRKVLGAIEDEGRRRGCSHVQLDTFEFQALGFYRSLGYEVFGTLERYVKDFDRYYLRKPLGPA